MKEGEVVGEESFWNGEMVPFIAPPEELQCARNGRKWRCSRWRIHGESYCEFHFLHQKNRCKQNPAKTRPHKKKRKRTNQNERVEEEKGISVLDKDYGNGGEVEPWSRRTRNAKFAAEKQENGPKSKGKKDGNGDKRESFSRTGNVSSAEKMEVAGGGYCHQCHQLKSRVQFCRKCQRKRYCDSCIKKWYPRFPEKAIAGSCPFCRKICNCKSCLRSDQLMKDVKNSGLPLNKEERIKHFKYLISLLYPFLKQFNEEQMKEIELQAKIQGLRSSEMELLRAVSSDYERLYCNNCKTSIVDLHRVCPKCSYELCLTCCWEIRGKCLRGGDKMVQRYFDRGKAYLHGGEPLSLDKEKNKTSSRKYVKLPSEWQVKGNGDIPCPVEKLGGCGHKCLELKCMLPANWVSMLKIKAERLVKLHKLDNGLGTLTGHCSCLFDNEIGVVNDAIQEHGSKERLYSPLAKDLQQGDLEHFQWHWIKGEPVIVRNVHELTSGLSWEPMVLWRAFRDVSNKKGSSNVNVRAIDCLDLCEVNVLVHSAEVIHTSDQLADIEILKMRHVRQDQMELYGNYKDSNLPLEEQVGMDVWPKHLKMESITSKKEVNPCQCSDSTTKLLMRTLGFQNEENSKLDKESNGRIKEAHTSDTSFSNMHFPNGWDEDSCLLMKGQVDADVMVKVVKSPKRKSRTRKKKVKSCQTSLLVQNKEELEVGESNRKIYKTHSDKAIDACLTNEASGGGALWDIFRRQDVPKLEEYLRKHHREFRHVYCSPVDQSCTKVALDFVSPENIHECIRLTEEFRVLPHEHRSKEDKLEVKKMMLHALKYAVEELEKFTA